MLGHLSAKRPQRIFNTPAFFPHFYSHTQAHPGGEMLLWLSHFSGGG
jgi:hypothetical protein